jgi:hypothetical protein
MFVPRLYVGMIGSPKIDEDDAFDPLWNVLEIKLDTALGVWRTVSDFRLVWGARVH